MNKNNKLTLHYYKCFLTLYSLLPFKISKVNTLNKLDLIIKSKPILTYSITALITCLILNIGIFKDYIFLDANEYLWTASRNADFLNEFIEGGRFLLGFICKFIYGFLCNTISDLKWVRLVSLLGCILFSIQIFSYLLKLKMRIYESALFAFLTLSIPSFSVYYGWSATSEIPFLLNINFFSGVLLMRFLNKKKNKFLNYFVSIVLVVISLCIYQSAVTIFIAPFIFYSILTKDFSIKKVFSILIFIGLSFSLYFIIFKLSLDWYNLEASNRASLDLLKLPIKIAKFYLKDMRMLLPSSAFIVSPIVFLIIGTSCFLGFLYNFYQKRTKIPQFYFFIFFLILVLPLMYSPNLLSPQDFFCSRAIAPSAIVILFYQFYFLRQISVKNIFLKNLSISLALLLIIFASINLNYYKVRAHTKEYNAIKKAFNSIPINSTKNIIIIKPKHGFLKEYGFYKRYSADEFAETSSARTWVPAPLFNQILLERIDSLGLEKNMFPPNKIKVIELGETYNRDDNSIVINLVEVLKNEFSNRYRL